MPPTVGTVYPTGDETQRLDAACVKLRNDEKTLFEKLREFCKEEDAGIEYLLLLTVAPLSTMKRHAVVPMRLTQSLHSIANSEELPRETAKKLASYVKALSDIPGFAEGLYLPEPGPSLKIDLLRLVAPLSVDYNLFAGTIIRTLIDLRLIEPDGDMRVAMAPLNSDKVTVMALTFYILGTAYTQATVTCALRKWAYQRYLGETDTDMLYNCMINMEGEWDGEFAEMPPVSLGGRRQGPSFSHGQFSTPSIIHYPVHGKTANPQLFYTYTHKASDLQLPSI